MDIEKVKVKVISLKAGGRVYLKDTEISKPFPPAIVEEIRAVVKGRSDTLEVIERTGDVKVETPPVVDEPAKEPELTPTLELTQTPVEEVETSDQEKETEEQEPVSDPPEITEDEPVETNNRTVIVTDGTKTVTDEEIDPKKDELKDKPDPEAKITLKKKKKLPMRSK